MKYTPALGFLGLTFTLAACGGRSDNQHAAAAGGSPTFGTGGASAFGGSNSSPNVDRTCNIPDDCVIQSLSCCPVCGVPNPSNYVAISRSAQDDFIRDLCPGDIACPGCNAQVGTNTLIATCNQGQCALINLLDSPITACSSADECYPRAPECCECGGSTNVYAVIALSSSSPISYASLVCPPSGACFTCDQTYPDVSVACVSGHCRVAE